MFGGLYWGQVGSTALGGASTLINGVLELDISSQAIEVETGQAEMELELSSEVLELDGSADELEVEIDGSSITN